MPRKLIALAAGVAAAMAASAAVAQECDLADGEKIFGRCQACHQLEEGRRGVGPHLFAIVGRDVASVEDYTYSKAMAAYGEGDAVWDTDRLNQYLENPRQEVKGTKMAFAGLRKPEQRASIICYLDTIE